MFRDDLITAQRATPAVGRYDLLIGAEAFWKRAAADIAKARGRVLVQAMTLEADAAGALLAEALLASPAAERRVLVDAYSFHVVNDTLLPYLPWRSAAVRAERRGLGRLLDRLRDGGVDVAVTNPVDGNPLNFPLRNHKKLIVADEVAYLGGINFADHNFAWHDAMVRIADADAAAFLAAAFTADRAGEPRCTAARFGKLDLISLDGASNEAALAPAIALFRDARRSIELIGAYPTLPFTDAFCAAARRGIAVAIYTPASSNKPLLRDYLFAVGQGQSAPKLALLPEMTHAKAALVDGETVLFGSVNFNLATWRSNGDFLAVSREADLVGAFERALFVPARAAARSPDAGEVAAWRRVKARILLTLADAGLARLAHRPRPRVAEWT